jgi:hypothetical protein
MRVSRAPPPGLTCGPCLRSPTAQPPATPPLPGPLSAPECTALILPPLARPQRGPKGQRGSYRVLPHLRWGRSTGRPWQGLPGPDAPDGPPARQATPVDKVWAPGAAEGALGQACVARGRPVATAPPRAPSVRPGAGRPTGAKKGALAWASRGSHPHRVRRAWPALTSQATSERPSPWRPSRRPIWGGCRRASKRCSRWRKRSGGSAEGPSARGRAAWRRRPIGRASAPRACAPIAPSIRLSRQNK